MSEESPPAPISTEGFSEPNLLPRPLKAPFILVPTGRAGVGGGLLHQSRHGEGLGKRHLHEEQEREGARRRAPRPWMFAPVTDS